ncbi:MAG: hypothetical protein LC720_00965 [Actinobacteria bacterium]|nr:hypothetical protein [Actinomycetota bacterium]
MRLPAGHPMTRVVTIENPLSEAQSVMRPTMLGSLLDIARHNVARGASALRIFESGSVYRRHRRHPDAASAPTPADEHHALGALVTGAIADRSWRAGPAPEADFFVVKALVAAVLDGLRVDWTVAALGWPFLHPGRSAEVRLGDRRVGFVGEVHPLVAGAWDLGRTAVFTLNLDVVAAAAPVVIGYDGFGDFPAVLEDISVIVDDGVAAEAVVALVRGHGGPELAEVEIFDVYRGAQVGVGRTSLSLHLEFRAADRTLTDEEVAARRTAITVALADELGGELRG